MADINMNWVERLRAPRYIWSQIAAHNPQRGILCREQESQQQLLTWDVETGETREITPPVPYTLNATLSPDGEFITYLRTHPTHPEVFQYVRVPYLGGDPQPIAPTALMYASPHIEEAANARIGFTAVTPNGYSVQVWTPTSTKPLFSFDSEILAYGPALSADGTIAVVATLHSDTSESTHLEAYNIDTGEKISQLELLDTPLEAVKFAPGMGDSRLLVQAREGVLTRPLIWGVRTGTVERVKGLKRSTSYTVWDWLDNKQLLLSYRDGGSFHIVTHDSEKRRTKAKLLAGQFLIAYVSHSKIIVHDEIIHGVGVISYERRAVGRKRLILFPFPQKAQGAYVGVISGNDSSPFLWRNQEQQSPARIWIEDTPRVIGIGFKDENAFYSEIAGWIEQDILHIGVTVQVSQTMPLATHAVQAIQKAHSYTFGPKPLGPSLLTAHNMAAALVLLSLHHDSSLWAGAIVVRPILDWVHLYESVSPPEKAMMRLWFGGSPTEKPDEWRAASPLRQTTPLTIPVKLLYHPYDTLTPIQHIQTYAANNPTVELIDISRDLVGPAHEQQQRLITRMLQVGLPLLKSGTV